MQGWGLKYSKLFGSYDVRWKILKTDSFERSSLFLGHMEKFLQYFEVGKTSNCRLCFICGSSKKHFEVYFPAHIVKYFHESKILFVIWIFVLFRHKVTQMKVLEIPSFSYTKNKRQASSTCKSVDTFFFF